MRDFTWSDVNLEIDSAKLPDGKSPGGKSPRGKSPGGWSPRDFRGIDIVGIDFSTSIQQVAGHVIRGWDRYRQQVDCHRHGQGIWVFGVNALPFPLTQQPVPTWQLPRLQHPHFQRRGHGPGLIEYGSAFYDYFVLALAHAQEVSAWSKRNRPKMPITVSLLCDGFPNGGTYRASDVRPQFEEARARGIRIRVVAFVPRCYRQNLQMFQDALGLMDDELEVGWYDEGSLDGDTIDSGFMSLSSC